MKSLHALFATLALLATAASPAFATTLTLTGNVQFSSLDGSADDSDPTPGVFTYNGDLVIDGTVNCNDDSPLPTTASACPISIHTTGNLTIDAGGGIFAENRRGAGNGGNVTLTVGGDLVLHGPAASLPGAVVSSSRTSTTSPGTDKAGKIQLTVGGQVAIEAGATVAANALNAAGGTIATHAQGSVTVAGLVASGPSSTLLSTALTGRVLSGINSGQAGGPITIAGAGGVIVSGTGVIASQGETPGADRITLEGCGIDIRGLVASVSKQSGPSEVIIRSGKGISIDGRDIGQTGPTSGRFGRVRADAVLGSAGTYGVDLFAQQAIQVQGPDPAATSVFAVTADPGTQGNSKGGTISGISLGGTLAASGAAFEAGRLQSGNQGGTIDLRAAGDVTLDDARLSAIGDYTGGNSQRKGGTLAVRSYAGQVSWHFGLGDVRPVGSGTPAANRGAITLTYCTSVDVTGSQFPTVGSPILPFPQEVQSCSPAAPSLPAGEPALPQCDVPPTAVDDSATVTEDDPATAINVLANDTDPDGGPKSIASVTQPAHGTVVITGGGTGLTYQPVGNYCNTPPGTTPDTFTYTLTPGGSTATVSVTVTCVDDPPVAVDDSATVTEDDPATAINVLANDTDADGGPKAIASVTQPGHGTVVITGGGTGLTYQPAANYCNNPPGTSPDTFTYTLTPGSSSATVSVTVNCVDDPPVAVNDSATVTEGDPATAIDVLANDTDIDGGPKAIASVTQPAHGTVVITGGGTGLTYQPNANYCNNPPGTSPDTFTYTLAPGGSTATVSVSVTCVDSPPVAVDDSATVTEDSGANAIDVLSNDTDSDGGPKSIASVTQPAHGTVVITGGGTGLTYQPAANYCNNPPGTSLDTFTYTLAPGGSTAMVTVTVTCVDDAPVAVDDTAELVEDGGPTPVDVLANDTDVDAGPKSIASVTQPANGTVAITGGGTGLTYNPAANYCNATFTALDLYHLGEGDGAGATDGSTVSTTVDAAGSFDLTAQGNPTYSATVPAGLSSTLSVHFDGSGDALTAANLATTAVDNFGLDAWVKADTASVADSILAYNGSPAASGWGLAVAGGNFVARFGGVATLTVAPVSTGWTHLVLIRQSGVTSVYVNGTRMATTSAVPNAPALASGGGILVGGDLAGGQSFAGTIDEVRIFTLTGSAPDTFTYTLTPGGSTATVSATVECVDDNPTAVNDSATVTEDDPATAIDVLANDTDPDGGPKSIASVTQPAHGTVVITGGGTGLTYQPAANYCNSVSGPADTFTYTLTPGSSTATVSVTVTCVDDPPVAVNDSASVTEDDPATPINVLANDTDIDGGPKSIASVTQPANGTVAITGGGTGLTYRPNANYCNNPPGSTPDTFTYTLTPGSSTATVSVLVTCVNDAPVLTHDPITYTTPGNTQLHVAGATLPGVAAWTDAQGALAKAAPTDIDGPAAPAVVPASGSSANGGSYSIAANGSFTYVPPAGFTGTDSFTYQVTDTVTPTTGTINIAVGQRVWYVRDVVDSDNPAGGDGRSNNAFDTLAALNATTTNAGDIIFIFAGNTGTTPLTGSVTLKDGQKLWGQGIALNVPGFGTPLAAAANKPRIRSTAASTPAVTVSASAASLANLEIRGLDLETTGATSNAIDATSSGASHNLTITVSDDNIRGATGKGINLAAGSAGGTFTATVQNNTVTAAGNGIDARSTAGALVLALNSNTGIVSGANGINVDGSAGGTTTITSFDSNTISGNTLGTGIAVTSAKFDPVPGTASYDTPVTGGTTVVGASGAGNGVGASGLVLSNITGDLAFTNFDVFADGGTAVKISGTGAVNTGAGTGTRVTVGAGVALVAATGGPAMDVTNATIDLQLASLTSTNSATTGVNLDTVAGTFSAPSGSAITNATGTDFNVNAGNAAVTYGGTITDTTGRLVSVAGTTGGTKSFTGAISDSGSGTGGGISLTGNTGATISFTGTLTLATGGNDAFTATGGGTVTSTDANSTVVTTTGTALNVANTTIGASGLKFKTVSAGTAASGPASGIILNTTGASGSLTVSGGTIQKTSSHGISLTSTLSPSFTGMTIQNTNGSGLNGTQVTNFSFTNGTITGSGTGGAADDSNISFNDSTTDANVSGTVTITGNTLNTSRYHGVDIQNPAGTVSSANISNNTFTSDTSVANSLGSAIRLIALGSATAVGNFTQATIANNTFTNFPSGAGVVIQGGNAADVAGAPSGTMGVPGGGLIAVTGNHMDGGSGGVGNQPDRFVTALVNGRGQGNFDISSNGTVAAPIRHIDGVVIELSAFGATTVTATVNNNVIAANNAVASAGIGIGCDADSLTTTTDNASLTTTISGNNVSQTDGPGIYALARNSSCTHITKILNNTVAAPATSTSARAGIRVDSGSAAGNTTVCAKISGNTTAGSTSTATSTTSPGINLRKQGTSTTTNIFGIDGLSPSPASTPAVENYVNGLNTSSSGTFGVGGTALLSATSGFTVCTAP